jgi:hypothetical protein
MSLRVLSLSEALASLSLTYLASVFFDPEDIRNLSIGAIWNFANGTGLLEFSTEQGAQRACLKALVHRAQKGFNPNTIQFNSISKELIGTQRLLLHTSDDLDLAVKLR